MNPEESGAALDDARSGGFVCGLLTARYYALRHAIRGEFFRAAAPSDTPEVVYRLMTRMCRSAIARRLFETSWVSLDHLLLCESTQELDRALALAFDHTLQ